MRCPALRDLPPAPAGRTGWPWTEASPPVPATMPDGSAWPRISIVTPSYNQGQYIEETIRSILLQGYPDLEYIVIDGGSTDGAVEVVRKYERWLAHWRTEPDQGQADAINKGLAVCTGEIFQFINSDDLLEPEALRHVAEAMPGHAGVVGHVLDFDRMQAKVWRHAPLSCNLLVEPGRRWHQPGVWLRSNVIRATGGYEIRYWYYFDLALMLRVLDMPSTRLNYVDRVLVRFRQHEAAKSSLKASDVDGGARAKVSAEFRAVLASFVSTTHQKSLIKKCRATIRDQLAETKIASISAADGWLLVKILKIILTILRYPGYMRSRVNIRRIRDHLRAASTAQRNSIKSVEAGRVVASWPSAAYANRCIGEIGQMLQARGWVIREADPLRPSTVTLVAEIVLIHWADKAFWSKVSAPRLALQAGLVLGYFAVMRLRGLHLVWIVHNVRPHNLSSQSLWIWSAYIAVFTRLINGWITLAPGTRKSVIDTYPRLARKPRTFIWHPPYECRGSDHGRRSTNCMSFAHIGHLRAYKGLLELIDVFTKLPDATTRLAIAGMPTEPSYARALLEKGTIDPRIAVRLGRLTDDEYVRLLATTDVFVASYVDSLHSGAVVHALCCGCVVVARANPFTRNLKRAVGGDWVVLHDGPLALADLYAARASVSRTRGQKPNLRLLDVTRNGARLDRFLRALITEKNKLAHRSRQHRHDVET